MENDKKERDWIDILAKLLPGLGALLAGILVPLVIHLNGERSRNNQLYAEIVSKREVSDSVLRELYGPHKSKRCGRVHG